jgi:Zn-dependent protease with chaperone function
MKQITVSENFKKMTMRAIGSILLFIATYFLLICLAIGVTIACGLLGYTLFAYHMSGYTFMLALGLVSMGILILIFLFKFIFKKHVTDLTHLTEITRDQEPQLFLMIEEIVKEVETDFPKKIYLSADVNAAVFYDSSFWSMFLPVKKNLQIGLGLVNSVTVIELRAILAHEFGHFSQRTMKVGSYVYNMNQIIYNMLFDNESYDALAGKWASASVYLAIFVGLAVKIIRGIQWILQKVYNVINLSYMSLSREMEFHADEVAANVTGSVPLITSLLRLELAEKSYQAVLSYYEGKISEAEKAQNIYPQQAYVMNFLAEQNKLPMENNLPMVTLDHLNRYNKSKLVIKDQWASHPTTEDRVRQLEKLNLETRDNDSKPASGLFKNMEVLQSELTEKIFASIEYSSPQVVKSKDQFIETFVADHLQNSFHQIYNTYYDNKNPSRMDIENIPKIPDKSIPALNDLFGEEALDYVYEFISLDSDISTLKQIQEGHYPIKSFDYDGIKYSPAESPVLIAELQNKWQEMKDNILQNDIKIYQYFSLLATKNGNESHLKSLYQKFFQIDIAIDDHFKVYSEMVSATGFIFQTTPFETIKENIKMLKEVEIDFKKEIRYMLEETVFQDHISEETGAKFNEYLSGNYTFFYDQEYKSSELDMLFAAINNYQTVMSKTYFGAKKQLLDYQVSLID